MSGLTWERSYPWIFAALIALLGVYLPRPIQQRMADVLFGHAITISAISVGFLATTQGVLITISDRPNVRRYTSSKYYDVFLSYLRHAIMVSLLLMVLSSAGSLYSPDTGTDTLSYFIPVWLFLFAGAVLTLFRVASVTSFLLRSAKDERQKITQPPQADPSLLDPDAS